jgi:biotin transport system substrate-specific component
VLGKDKLITSDHTSVDSYALLAFSHSSKAVLYGAAGAVVFAALTFVGANIYIPLKPVPITLQTLFVLLAGAVIGGRYGALGQFLYVGLGALGLPFFAAQSSGWGVIVGPTGGYLLSFLLVPFFVGAFIRKSSSIIWQTGVFSAGTLMIFALGVAHLTAFYTHDLAAAVYVGLLPFLPGAVLKVFAAVSIYRSVSALARSRRSN